MKKLITSILFLMITSIAFSQKDTTETNKTTCFSNKVAKLVIKDLMSGDSAKVLLKLTESQLDSTEKKVILKDSIINKLEKKVENCESIVNMQNTKYGILETHTKTVEKLLKKEKVKNKFQKIVSGSVILVLTYLLLIK